MECSPLFSLTTSPRKGLERLHRRTPTVRRRIPALRQLTYWAGLGAPYFLPVKFFRYSIDKLLPAFE